MLTLNQFYLNINFPEDILTVIFEFSNLNTLLELYSLNKKWNAWIKKDIDPDRWRKLISKLPRGFCAPCLKRKSLITYAPIKERRCSLCYLPYRGKVDSVFGTWAHPRCRRERQMNTYYTWFLYSTTYEELAQHCRLPIKQLEGNGGYRYNVVWQKRHWCIPDSDTLDGIILQNLNVRNLCIDGVGLKLSRWEEGVINKRTIQMERRGMYELIRLIGIENV